MPMYSNKKNNAKLPDQDEVLTYKEMRAVAQEIFKYEANMRKIRTGAMLCGGLLITLVVTLGGVLLILQFTVDTDVDCGGKQCAWVKRGTKKVIQTTESLEDLDASDLTDYERDQTDANGDEDGEWVLSDAKLSMIRTISWRENDTMYVQHVAEIRRVNGQDTRVEITTKAGHKMTIWDNDGVDNFNVMISRYDQETNTYGPETEVLPDGDEGDLGRGRVMVSLKRPDLSYKVRDVKMEEYF